MTVSYKQTLVMPGNPVTQKITKLQDWQLPPENLYVLLRDVEMDKDRGLTGVPQTVHFHVPPGSREMFPMIDEMENFFTALTHDFPMEKLEQICDAFFILGSKYYQGSPKYPGYLGFGGGTVRCIGKQDGMLMIEAVNPANLPSPASFVSYENYAIGEPLKIPLTTVNGIHTYPFPHNDGQDIFSVLFSDVGYLLIEPERCRKVTKPEFPYR